MSEENAKSDKAKVPDTPPEVKTFTEAEIEELKKQLLEPAPKRPRDEEDDQADAAAGAQRKRIPTKSTELKTLEMVLTKMGKIEDTLAESRAAPAPLSLPVKYNWSTTERTVKTYQAAAVAFSGSLSTFFFLHHVIYLCELFRSFFFYVFFVFIFSLFYE